MDSLFTWQALATLSGATTFVFIITLYTGRLVEIWWTWGTDLYAALWAFVILVITALATGAPGLDWKLYALAFCNSFIVAMAAGKMRDKSIAEADRKYIDTNVK